MPRLTQLALLLHMHQPDYVDPSTGRAELPWARLHGSRGYLDLARLLLEYEDVRLTVNFVPSLVRQLEEAARGASDRWLEIAGKAERDWTPEDRVFLIERHFSINWGRAIDTRPRYRELLDKRGRQTPLGALGDRVDRFSDEDLRDLTVLFQLAWIGFAARTGDAELEALERKERGYDLADLALVVDRQRRACAQVLPLWRRLAERGQVELSASPYYHPIVPLLVDTNHAARAQPDLPLPTRYAWPDDAALQIRRGVEAHARSFGAPPAGMWPPEGSVSPEAVAAYERAGIGWLATDEGNLWRSRAAAGLANPRGELYRPHRYGGVDLVFRDRELSDRIGFAYMHGDPTAGVDDLLGRATASAEHSAAPAGEPALVGVFLDGENPWESYPGSGEPFLRTLFERLSRGVRQGGWLRPATISEHLAAAPTRGALPALHSGSWIDSDFHIWIGDPVKNRGWDLLGQARRRIEERRQRGDHAVAEAALERLLAAEGSDWFWWFGAPFTSAEDPIFDRLFRAHIEGAYRALGEPPPVELLRPVDDQAGARAGAAGVKQPRALIHPAIGNERGGRGYFAWAGAGLLEVARGAAMAELPLVERIRFGFDRERLSLRIEGHAARAAELAAADIELELVHRGGRFRLRLGAAAPWHLDEAQGDSWIDRGEGEPAERHDGAPAMIDLAVPWARLHAEPRAEVGLVVRVLAGAVVLARYPAEDALIVTVADDDFEADHWSV